MPPLPYTVRFPGVDRAHRYCPSDESAEQTAVDLLRGTPPLPVVEIHYRNRLVLVITQADWQTHTKEHGVWNEYLNRGKGGWHIPAEHLLVHRIRAAVEALGDAPPAPSGKKQKAAVAVLVAKGIPEADAIARVAAVGPEKAVFE